MLLGEKELSKGWVFELNQFLLHIEEHLFQEFQEFFGVVVEPGTFKGKVVKEIQQTINIMNTKILTRRLSRSAS